MFKFSDINLKVDKMIVESIRHRVPTEFFDCLHLPVSDFLSEKEYSDVVFYPNPKAAFRVKPNYPMYLGLGILFAMKLQKNLGITIPLNMCNNTGFKFLACCYMLSVVQCYIEERTVKGFTSCVIRGKSLKEFDTVKARKDLQEKLINYTYPADKLNPSVDYKGNRVNADPTTRYTFRFNQIEYTLEIDNGGVENMLFTAICPYKTFLSVASLYQAIAEKYLVNFVYLKRDCSVRVARMTVNKDILMGLFNDKDRVDRVAESYIKEKRIYHRGYIKLPEIDLPADDQGVRAVNITKILEFSVLNPRELSQNSKASVVTKRISGARYVLVNLLLDEEENALDTQLKLVEVLGKEYPEQVGVMQGFINSVNDKRIIPTIIGKKLNEYFGSTEESAIILDTKAYRVIATVLTESVADDLMSGRGVNMTTDLVDYTKEFKQIEDKLEFVNALARENCVVIDYRKVDGTFERTAFTKNSSIVDKVYGLTWRSVQANTLLSKNISILENYLELLKTEDMSIYGHIAKEAGISIRQCKTLVEAKMNLQRALNHMLQELKDRFEVSRPAVKKRKDSGNISGFTLTITPEVMESGKATLFRSYKPLGIQAIYTKAV